MSLATFQRATAWRQLNLRAAGLLLLVLLSWAAVPAELLAQEPDFCAMECCVAEGHCCCAARKPWVEGQVRGDHPEVGLMQLAAACPCPTTPPAKSTIFPRTLARLAARDHTPAKPNQFISYDAESGYRSPHFTPRSLRAPPTLLLGL